MQPNVAARTEDAPSAMSYGRTRALLLAAGLAILLVTAAVMYVRRVEPVEVIAVLLFVPVFLAFMFAKVPGGLAAGVLAGLAYLALRYPAVEAIGAERFRGLLLSRAVAYLAFGGLGGLAMRQLEASLTKLDLYDQIDDASGLYNSRFYVEDTDLEMARSRRYHSIFSVAVVDVPTNLLAGFSRRRRAALVRELGRRLQGSVRSVDRPVHGNDSERHRFAVVLPETGAGGASLFADRLAEQITDFLLRRGVPVTPEQIARLAAAYPEAEEEIQQTRRYFAEIDRLEHPESALPGTHPETRETSGQS